MDIRISIAVFDVDNTPVNECAFEVTAGNILIGGKTDGNQKTVDIADSADGWTITVGNDHVDYFKETTLIHRNKTWTNPTCSVTTGMEGGIDVFRVRFVLSRIRLAQMQYIPDAVLKGLKDVPSGVLLSDERLAPRSQLPFNYRSLFTDKFDVFRLEHPILPAQPGNDWDRFRHKVVEVDPLHYGSFRWLEYGKGTKRYTVAVWLPWAYLLGMEQHQLDFILFFSPPTALGKYVLDSGQTYPYGLQRAGSGRIQPYMSLGHAYCFNVSYLLYQLIAARKKAVFVMPINNFGEWGPFSSGPGLYRLFNEIAHYMSKMRRKMAAHVPIHGIHTAAIAGYSQGLEPLNELLKDATKKGPMPDLFYTTRTTAFRDCWKELWDIDLKLGGVVGEFESKFTNWLHGGSGRQFRMYHSQFTAGNWRPSNGPVLSKVNGRQLVSRTTSEGATAEEMHAQDGTWSAVYLSDTYLARTKSLKFGSVPSFSVNDPHHFVPQFALGHAALRSNFSALNLR